MVIEIHEFEMDRVERDASQREMKCHYDPIYKLLIDDLFLIFKISKIQDRQMYRPAMVLYQQLV